MPKITAGSVYMRLTGRVPNSPRATMSSMPPRLNSIIQPAVRVVEPMNRGSTVRTTSTGFQRPEARANRHAIGRPHARHATVTMIETRIVVYSTPR